MGRRNQPGYIYFAEMDRLRLVKVGFAVDVPSRIANLRTASPFDIYVTETFPGTKADEQRIHQLLVASRYNREWFRATNEVYEFLDEAEGYRRDTFVERVFDRAIHKTPQQICDAIEDLPITEFIANYQPDPSAND